MSSLLEQAIIDANALREAAVKNAESAILDKYSTDIREAVESLLEQEEEAEESGLTSSTNLQDSIPLAAATSAETSLDEDEKIELDLDSLISLAEKLTEEEEGEQASHQAAAPSDLGAPEEIETASVEVALEEVVNTKNARSGDRRSSPEGTKDECTAAAEKLGLEGQAKMNYVGACQQGYLEEDAEIEIDGLDELIEELVVDIAPQKSGWAGTPDPIMDYKEEMELARRSATEAEKQVKDLTQAGERLSEQNEKLKAKNAKMLEALQTIKESFNKINLSNARLVYTNKVLTDDSLNERQKNKIVEALSKSDSIEEAKVIFETLKSAVGSVSGKAHPQSLRETIERPSATLPRREARTSHDTPVMDRMQILAGIKTHK